MFLNSTLVSYQENTTILLSNKATFFEFESLCCPKFLNVTETKLPQKREELFSFEVDDFKKISDSVALKIISGVIFIVIIWNIYTIKMLECIQYY